MRHLQIKTRTVFFFSARWAGATVKSGAQCANEGWLQVTGIDLIYNEDKNIISRTELKMPDTAVPSFIPREWRSRSNRGTLDVGNERDRKKRCRHGWMLSPLICLTHSLLKWEWMEGFPMSWLEDGWVCSFGRNWLKTGIQLGIIESWKSLKAQVHEIIRRANQVVINPRCKWCVGYGRKGACYRGSI